MAQHLLDLRLPAEAAHAGHQVEKLRRAGRPFAGPALAEAAIIDELHLEPAQSGRLLEHLALQPAGTVPGRLAARRRVHRENQPPAPAAVALRRTDEHTSELQSLLRHSYAV